MWTLLTLYFCNRQIRAHEMKMDDDIENMSPDIDSYGESPSVDGINYKIDSAVSLSLSADEVPANRMNRNKPTRILFAWNCIDYENQ